VSTQRIHFMGAPGSGVTSIGKALATVLQLPLFDTDSFVWFTDDALPYRRKRNTQHRLKFAKEALSAHPSWVLSGSLCGWGDALIPEFDLVVFLNAPAQVRIERIIKREIKRYGAARLIHGGDLQGVFDKFCNWAAAYSEPGASPNIRSEAAEREWLSEKITCPVLEFDTSLFSLDEIVQQIVLAVKSE
jgi:adenylate kinase family enzyme